MAQRKDQKSAKSKKQKSTHSKPHKNTSPKFEETLDDKSDLTDETETEAWAQQAQSAGEKEANTYEKEEDTFEESFQADAGSNGHGDGNGHNESTSDSREEESVRLDFPYSDMLRAYAPEAMKVADKVATDWQKEGNFMNLGIENPYANMAVSMGLQKAKEVEKKLEEKGVLSAVRMGFEVLKHQVNKRR